MWWCCRQDGHGCVRTGITRESFCSAAAATCQRACACHDIANGLLCSAKRWSESIDPVTGRTVGAQLMLNQSFKTSEGYKWGGLGVVIFASFLFNALIWLVLAKLPGENELHSDTAANLKLRVRQHGVNAQM